MPLERLALEGQSAKAFGVVQNILWGFLSFLFWLNTFATTLAVNLLFLFLAIFFCELGKNQEEETALHSLCWQTSPHTC